MVENGGGGETLESKEEKFVVDMDSESRGTEPFAIPSPTREAKPAKRSRKKCCLWCCGISTGVAVLVIVILIILAFTVFKPKDADLSVNSVTLNSIAVNLNLLNPTVDVSLDTKVTVKNPNYASFKYRNTTAYIYYHGKEIGESSIAEGKIKSRGSVKLDVPVDVRITGDLFNANLSQDIGSGILPVATRVQIKGKVKFLGFIKLNHARSNSYCEIEIFLSNATLKDIDCKNKFKI